MRLTRTVHGIEFHTLYPDGLPRWRSSYRVPECDRRVIGPTWAIWLLRAFVVGEWQGWIYRPLIRVGFLQGPEGAFYSEFRWNWRWWESQYARCGQIPRWFAFGRFIERESAKLRWPD